MIDDPVLRWVVTLLFGFSAVQCLWSVITGGRSVTATIGNVLHAVMSVAMAVMAWPAGAELPTRAPMVFFLLAAIWFAVAAARTAGPGGDNVFLAAYHALMMLAMSWMYAAMGGLPLRRAAPAGTAGRQHGAQHGADHGAHHGQHGGGHAAHHGGSDGAVDVLRSGVGGLEHGGPGGRVDDRLGGPRGRRGPCPTDEVLVTQVGHGHVCHPPRVVDVLRFSLMGVRQPSWPRRFIG